MVFLGGISYSLYLWHWPIINLYGDWRGQGPNWLTGPAIVIVSVLLAWLTKVFIEDKIRLSPLLSGHRWRSVSVALAAGVPVALVSGYLANPVTWNGRLPASGYPGAAALASATLARVPVEPILPPITDASADRPMYWQRNCLDDDEATTEVICMFGDTKKPALTVAMVGDSIDGNWFPSLEQIALPTAEAVLNDPPTLRADKDTGGKVKVIDMDRFICGPIECDPVVGNVLVYLDGRHLTAAYATSLTKYLEPRLLHAVPLLAR